MPTKKQQQVQQTVDKRFVDWDGLQKILRGDVFSLLEILEKDNDNQTLRRAYVRGVCGYFEGCTNGLYAFLEKANQHCPDDEKLKLPDINKDDFAYIKIEKIIEWCENRLQVSHEEAFFKERLEKLKPVFVLRNHLMHPENPSKLVVEEAAIEEIRLGLMIYLESMDSIYARFQTMQDS